MRKNKRKLKLDIVLPVYYKSLSEVEWSVAEQFKYFNKNLKDYDWKIILSINGLYPEKLIALAKKLKKKYKKFTYVHTPDIGRGSGIMRAWKASNADIMSFMDIDLATDLSCFNGLIKPLTEGYDMSIGSRYHPDSRTSRTLKRLFLSLIYNSFFVGLILNMKYKDAQCGFKAITREVAKKILPLSNNKEWSFDTEIIYLADRFGFKIKDVPVIWKEYEKSTLNLIKATWEYFKSIFELRFRKIE